MKSVSYNFLIAGETAVRVSAIFMFLKLRPTYTLVRPGAFQPGISSDYIHRKLTYLSEGGVLIKEYDNIAGREKGSSSAGMSIGHVVIIAGNLLRRCDTECDPLENHLLARQVEAHFAGLYRWLKAAAELPSIGIEEKRVIC